MICYTQQHRRIAVHTPLGDDALLLTAFAGREEFSRLFHFELDMLSLDDAIDPRRLIGKPVSFYIRDNDGKPRRFHGYISRFSACGADDRLSRYRAEVVPWLWFLTRNRNCRIFQHHSVPEIVERVLHDAGFRDFDTSGITGRHVKREYCVQYGESDFNFVSRLMEDEGIYYYFIHGKNKHTMVLGDQKEAYRKSPHAKVRLSANPGGLEITDEIYRWESTYEFRAGRVAHTDFNFLNPTTNMVAGTQTIAEFDAADRFEIFEYPGGYTQRPDGESLARTRMEEEEVACCVVKGEGVCRGFAPGHTFALGIATDREYASPRSHVLCSVTHYARLADPYLSQNDPAGSEASVDYRNEFTCIPASTTFRPRRVTQKPHVPGTQTAMVVGPAGEEIYTDEHGRVKVQFHWDRYGKRDENASCWIRSSQPWAGKGWGGIQIPRIGQEVIVDFIEGDPDRPIITGRVYNAASMPPVSGAGRDESKGEVNPTNMKEAAMQMSLRSNSLGGSGGYNEITMHDAGGAEKLYFRAQKDEVHEVLNDRKDTVGNDEVSEVGNDRTDSVGNDEIHTVGNDLTVEVGNIASEAVGNDKFVDVGNSLVVSAGTSITLKCGASSIHMNQAGFITISGTVVNIAGAVNANLVAPMTNVAGGIMLTNTGALNLVTGAVTRVTGQSLAHLGGGKSEVVSSGETLIKGAPVKVNC